MKHSRKNRCWKNCRLREPLLDYFLLSVDLEGKFLPLMLSRDFLLESVLKCRQLFVPRAFTWGWVMQRADSLQLLSSTMEKPPSVKPPRLSLLQHVPCGHPWPEKTCTLPKCTAFPGPGLGRGRGGEGDGVSEWTGLLWERGGRFRNFLPP